MFSSEYTELLNLISEHCSSGAEITLEANPNDINSHRLDTWRSLGINRVSLGVQTFDERGLQVLTREHDRTEAIQAIELAKKYFDNVNVDLIYGWGGQTTDQWAEDLQLIRKLEPTHASLYLLTYSGKTPFARLQRAGKIGQEKSKTLEDFYLRACETMHAAGYDHEEVSNWSKKGFSCQHNWIYWQMEPYLAIGSGAHGFLNRGAIGIRYSYPPSLLGFIRSPSVELDVRTHDQWLMEYIATSLRTNVGVSLSLITEKVGMVFKPSLNVQKGIDEEMVGFCENHLILTEKEWFREHAWAFEVYQCFS